MTFGSVCSGIEAASVAWYPLGWRAAFLAEIDPFASAVLDARRPGVPNLGDFTTIEASSEPIDLLVGGTPCQTFSVAGRRAGLDDPRGVLAFEFLRLAGRLQPRWVVFENVPGLLSSNSGRDFGAFLGALGQLGYGWAYRVLDARFFGVPQRRRRVFVVGHSGGLWQRAVAVLFERHCLSGHPPEGRQAESGLAPSVMPGARRASGQRAGEQLTVARSLTARNTRIDGDTETFIDVAHPVVSGTGSRCPGNAWNTNYVAHTLRADGFDASEDGTGRGTPLVPVCFRDERGRDSGDRAIEDQAFPLHAAKGPSEQQIVAYQCHGTNVGPMGTIRAGNGHETGGVPFVVNAAESCAKQRHARESETARCLDSTGSFANAQGGTVVVQEDGQNGVTLRDTAGSLRADAPGSQPCGSLLMAASAVRRLTPRECERLQGFPDDWTLVPYRGKPAKDGPRYRAIGNSMAVPVVRWIGERIDLLERTTA